LDEPERQRCFIRRIIIAIGDFGEWVSGQGESGLSSGRRNSPEGEARGAGLVSHPYRKIIHR